LGFKFTEELKCTFDFALLKALKAQIEALRFDPEIRVIIITGAGDRAFCAGADLKERVTLSPIQVKEYIFTIRNLFTSMAPCMNDACKQFITVFENMPMNWFLQSTG